MEEKDVVGQDLEELEAPRPIVIAISESRLIWGAVLSLLLVCLIQGVLLIRVSGQMDSMSVTRTPGPLQAVGSRVFGFSGTQGDTDPGVAATGTGAQTREAPDMLLLLDAFVAHHEIDEATAGKMRDQLLQTQERLHTLVSPGNMEAPEDVVYFALEAEEIVRLMGELELLVGPERARQLRDQLIMSTLVPQKTETEDLGPVPIEDKREGGG